jgi:BASS family bile acid:Na+ symporter
VPIDLHKNTAFILTLAVALGFLLPDPAERIEPLVIPALFLMMAFSMAGIDLGIPPIRGAMAGFLINYLFLSGLILSIAPLVLEEEALVLGFVVMAAVPPAVAVVPLTKLLAGDVRLALYSEALSYLASLALTPLIVLLFAGEAGAGVRVGDTLEIVLLLILLPLLVSRYVDRLRIDPAHPINAGLFAVTYIVVGLNSEAISIKAAWVAGVLLIAFVRTFASGAIVYAASALAGVERPQRVALTLFGSFKNLGLAATVALLLFGPRAAVPAAVCILTETGFYILLSALAGRRRRGADSSTPSTATSTQR